MLKIDFHTHTSDDPIDAIPYSSRELIDRAAGLGFDALAITLHERQLDVEPLTAYAQQRGIVLIPGIERTIEGCHVLLLDFSRDTERVQTFEDLAQLKRREQGLVIAPHPFFPARVCLGSRLEAHAELFDAVEWNAMFTAHINFNARAARWAAAHGRPLVGNGDVHRLHQLGTCYSMVDASPTPAAICEAVRSGRVTVQATPVTLATAVLTVASMELSHWIHPRRRGLPEEDVARAPGVGAARART